MSLYEELTQMTYVDGHTDIDNYKYPCNRYISYTKKFLPASSENNSELYQYVSHMLDMFMRAYPNPQNPKLASDMALSSWIKAMERFDSDNNNLFSDYKNSDVHFIKKYMQAEKGKYRITHFAKCTDYYSHFEPACTVCKLCSDFLGTHAQTNTSESFEETFLDIFTLNKENFYYLKPFVEEHLDELFTCALDLHIGLKPLSGALPPAIISVYREFVRALLESELDFWHSSAIELSSNLSVICKNNLSDSIYGEYRNATDNLLTSIISVIAFHFFGADAVKSAVSMETVSSLNEWLNSRCGASIELSMLILSNADQHDADINAAEECSQLTTPLSSPISEPAASVKKNLFALITSPTDIDIISPNGGNTSDEKIYIDEEILNNSPIDSVAKEITSVENKPCYGSLVVGKGEDDFIINNEFRDVDNYAEHLKNSTAWMFFENTVLSDRFMAVEALRDANGADFLLFFGRSRKCFFYLYMTDAETLSMIKPYLTRNSYIKITYQPYHIYSFGRKYNIELKRVFSIQTCYSFFNKQTPLLSYEDTINSFCTKKISDNMDDGYPMLLAGMKMYPYIYSQCNRLLKNSDTLSQMDTFVHYDEAIGCSYYIEGLYEDTKSIPAYKLVGNGAYFFPVEERGRVLIAGRYFDFRIGEGYSENEAKKVIVGVITYLAEKGRFRKCNIYVCDITPVMVRFFIPAYYVKYFETLFSRIFSDIAREKVGKKLNLLLREEIAEAVPEPKDPSFNEVFSSDLMAPQ